MSELQKTEGNTSKKVRISKDPDERKKEIIETALALFSSKGYKHTSISDIAEKMNVSQGLCYRYFKSKAELYEAATALYTDRVMNHFQIKKTDNRSALEKLKEFCSQIYEDVLKNKNLESSGEGKLKAHLESRNQVAEKMIQIMIPIIKQGVSEKVFNCRNIEDTTRFLVYGVLYAFHSNIPEDNKKDYINYFYDFLWEQMRRTFGIVEDN